MTEKRFEVIEDDDFDIEYISDKYSFGKSISSMDTCCDIMNRLNEENEQLKQEIEELKSNLKFARMDSAIDRMAQRPIKW